MGLVQPYLQGEWVSQLLECWFCGLGQLDLSWMPAFSHQLIPNSYKSKKHVLSLNIVRLGQVIRTGIMILSLDLHSPISTHLVYLPASHSIQLLFLVFGHSVQSESSSFSQMKHSELGPIKNHPPTLYQAIIQQLYSSLQYHR